MSTNLVDIIIILFIALGGIIGFKHGVIKEGTKFIGLFVVIVISFILKDKLMIFLYEHLPFFEFFGAIKGVGAINVLFYQLISFLIIFLGIMFILNILLVITGLVEWLVKMTIFLSFPSKILGMLVGMLEYYIYAFIIIYIIHIPVFNLEFVNESKLGMFVLESTPILSELVDDTVQVYSEVWDVIKNRDNKSSKEVNTMVLVILLDNKLISVESAKELVEKNRIIIEDTSILDNYNDDGTLYEILKEDYYGN